MGSCFSEEMTARLAQAKFRVAGNPSGILFNPASIAVALMQYASGQAVAQRELGFDGELWFHYDFHGKFSAPDPAQAINGMNAARREGYDALCAADRVILTFGTAWVFEHAGRVVANCHRQNAAQFIRRRLDVAEIVAAYDRLLTGILADKEVIFTVSPVRHAQDLQENAVSKAVLRLAVEELVQKHANAHYFPSFELLMDDLRDYRFYADDLRHPAPSAVAYIWEKFVQVALTEQAQALLPQIERIVQAAAHRPRNPQSEAYRALCRRSLAEIAALPDLDFSAEEAVFGL